MPEEEDEGVAGLVIVPATEEKMQERLQGAFKDFAERMRWLDQAGCVSVDTLRMRVTY